MSAQHSLNVPTTQLFADALRTTYATLAEGAEPAAVARAYATTRDAIDASAMLPEIAARVLLGALPLPQALRDTADVQRDFAAGCEEALAWDCNCFAAQLESAAATLERTCV